MRTDSSFPVRYRSDVVFHRATRQTHVAPWLRSGMPMKRTCHDCRKLRKFYCLQAVCDIAQIASRREDDDGALNFGPDARRGPA